MDIRSVLIVGAGSCLGGIARYLVGKVIHAPAEGCFPWGTFVVNMLGCLAIGLVYGLMCRGGHIPDAVRLFLAVGFCGGFTTFSTFSHENFLLLGSGHLWLFVAYVIASLVIGVLMVYSGYLVSRLS